MKLTSFGPMGPGGIAFALAEPLRRVRRSIELTARGEDASEHIAKAIEGIAAPLSLFDGDVTPPGFYHFEASGVKLDLRHRIDTLKMLAGFKPGCDKLGSLWVVYRDLMRNIDRLDEIECDALRRHNAKAEAEGGES